MKPRVKKYIVAPATAAEMYRVLGIKKREIKIVKLVLDLENENIPEEERKKMEKTLKALITEDKRVEKAKEKRRRARRK